ncbi:hypothetical protein LAWI1_G008973, partial [Lachnellula willkommii]
SPIPTQSSSNPNSNPTHYNYNFNTGLPTSVSSTTPSIHGNSNSIPTSPPPSFHTTSSPGTPRPLPLPSQELWGIAPSTITLSTSLSSTGAPDDAPSPENNNDSPTITSLKQRVEWLEESIGRLLLSKEESSPDTRNHIEEEEEQEGINSYRGGPKRSNCCVTFAATHPDAERALRRESNCCVRFRSGEEKNRQLRWMLVVCFCFLVAVVGFTVVMVSGRERVVSVAASEEGVLNVRL